LLSLDTILNKEIEVTEEIVIEDKTSSKQIRLIQKLDKYRSGISIGCKFF